MCAVKCKLANGQNQLAGVRSPLLSKRNTQNNKKQLPSVQHGSLYAMKKRDILLYVALLHYLVPYN